MNSFEGHPVIITETRFQELTEKEKKLDELLAKHPELAEGKKLTSTAKRYKKALSSFVDRVDQVLSSKEIQGVFEIAHVHGFPYKGPSLAQDILDAKKLLGSK